MSVLIFKTSTLMWFHCKCFGNIQYLSCACLGHEASFVGLLCCMMKMRVFQVEDAAAVALKVFNR